MWAEAGKLVDICLEAGLTMFDSADVLFGRAGGGDPGPGDQRRSAGQGVDLDEGDLPERGGPNDVGSSRFHLIEAVNGSLKRLGTDHIDLFQLHGFDAVTPVEETLSTLDDLVRAGKIRCGGLLEFLGLAFDEIARGSREIRLPALRGLIRPISSLVGRSWEAELMRVSAWIRVSARWSGARWAGPA